MKIILSGPSGAGKDTLIDMWITKNPHVKRAITATTRSPRDGEQNGVDYLFYSREEMESRINLNEFIEHKDVFGNIYGTPRESVDAAEKDGGIAIIRVDVQGALELIPKMQDAISVFILPPSLTELQNRILKRKKDTAEEIKKRMDTAIAEIVCSYFYDNQLINDNLEEAVNKLESILDGNRFENTELADTCLHMTLTKMTIEKIEEYLALADENGLSSKNPQNAVDTL